MQGADAGYCFDEVEMSLIVIIFVAGIILVLLLLRRLSIMRDRERQSYEER